MPIASLLLPDFLLIAGGAALRRLPLFDQSFWTGFERLVYYVLIPALLFRSLSRAPLVGEESLRLVIVGVGFTLAGILLSLVPWRLRRLPHRRFGSCLQCAFRFNTYLALALAHRLQGESGVASLGLLIGVLVPVSNIAAVTALAHGGIGQVSRELSRNPLVLSCVAGLACNALKLSVPTIALAVIDELSSAALATGLIAVGAGLRFSRSNVPWQALWYWNAIKLIALPIIAWLLTRTMHLPPMQSQIALLAAAVPTAPSAYILAVQMKGDGPAVALLISSQTLLALVTLPLWLAATA